MTTLILTQNGHNDDLAAALGTEVQWFTDPEKLVEAADDSSPVVIDDVSFGGPGDEDKIAFAMCRLSTSNPNIHCLILVGDTDPHHIACRITDPDRFHCHLASDPLEQDRNWLLGQ